MLLTTLTSSQRPQKRSIAKSDNRNRKPVRLPPHMHVRAHQMHMLGRPAVAVAGAWRHGGRGGRAYRGGCAAESSSIAFPSGRKRRKARRSNTVVL